VILFDIYPYIQGVSEVGVLILTSGRTLQFMKFKLFNCFYNNNIFDDAPFQSQEKIFAFTHRRVHILMANLFQILNQFVMLFRKKF
jgi:hypothetical protein